MATRNRGARPASKEWRGPILFSYGFRPFFLLAGLFAVIAIIAWTWFLETGDWVSQYEPLDWHIHEMAFGYVSAVIAGFLYTAIPNWTGRMPIKGWPLIAMVGLWIGGRAMMLAPEGTDARLIAVVDALFLATLVVVAAREIIAGRNFKNLIVLAPVSFMAIANGIFHYEAIYGAGPDIGPRLGLAAVFILISVIGGRVIPSFTRNWLSQQNPGRLPAPFGRFDAGVLAITAVGLGAWAFAPEWAGTGVLLLLAGGINVIRLGRWAGDRAATNILLFVLHVFFAFLPLGLLFLSAGALTGELAWRIAGIHILSIGVIGGVTVSMMARASLGHTGRALNASPILTCAFWLLIGAVATRTIGAFLPDAPWLILASAVCWAGAFACYVGAIGPCLVKPKWQKSG